MNLDLTLALSDEDIAPFEPDGIVKALVFYQNPAAARRAISSLRRIARGTEGEGRLLYTIWQFDFLADPSLMRIALWESGDVDIIILALSSPQHLPPLPSDWLNHWAHTGDSRPMALGVIMEPAAPACGPDSVALTQFQEAARLANIDFFAWGGGQEAGTSLGSDMPLTRNPQQMGLPLRAAAPRRNQARTPNPPLSAMTSLGGNSILKVSVQQ
jgi:hypothetical protein